jgi:hypothetical protein
MINFRKRSSDHRGLPSLPFVSDGRSALNELVIFSAGGYYLSLDFAVGVLYMIDMLVFR